MKNLIGNLTAPFTKRYFAFFLAGFGFSLVWFMGMVFLFFDVLRQSVPNFWVFFLSVVGGCALFSGIISHFNKGPVRTPWWLFHALMTGAVLFWICAILLLVYAFSRIVYIRH